MRAYFESFKSFKSFKIYGEFIYFEFIFCEFIHFELTCVLTRYVLTRYTDTGRGNTCALVFCVSCVFCAGPVLRWPSLADLATKRKNSNCSQ